MKYTEFIEMKLKYKYTQNRRKNKHIFVYFIRKQMS